jgi:hypothetical protein
MFWTKKVQHKEEDKLVDTYTDLQSMIKYLDSGHWPGNLYYPLISEQLDPPIKIASAKIQGALVRKYRAELFEEIVYLKYGKKYSNLTQLIQKDGDTYLLKIFEECCRGIKGLRREWCKISSSAYDIPLNEFSLTEEEYNKYFKK